MDGYKPAVHAKDPTAAADRTFSVRYNSSQGDQKTRTPRSPFNVIDRLGYCCRPLHRQRAEKAWCKKNGAVERSSSNRVHCRRNGTTPNKK
ncbi:unnamed protein product [Ectocarpus sp. 13 AM-2016]